MNIEVFLSAAGGVGVVGVMVTFWVRNYFGKYIAKKAENLATHEDIQKLVDQVRETERVKAEIADRMWDRQRRWDAKKDLYLEIYSSLHKLHDLLIDVAEGRRAISVRGEGADHTPLVEAINQLKSDFDKFSRVGFVAPLFFSDAALNSIANISGQAATWVTIVTGDELLELLQRHELDKAQQDFQLKFHDAILDLSAAARRDLGYPTASIEVPRFIQANALRVVTKRGQSARRAPPRSRTSQPSRIIHFPLAPPRFP
jgi:hypothetical protein